MTAETELTIRLAGTGDIDALMALEARYYIGNLDPAQRADGYLSVLHSSQWFIDTVRAGGIHVAETGGVVGGFIAVTPPPARVDPRAGPIIKAVLELAEALEFRGVPIARQRWAFRGPVLIDRSLRGRGVYTAFNDVTRAAYRDRYDVGVLFVAADNPVRCTPRPPNSELRCLPSSTPTAAATTSWPTPSVAATNRSAHDRKDALA